MKSPYRAVLFAAGVAGCALQAPDRPAASRPVTTYQAPPVRLVRFDVRPSRGVAFAGPAELEISYEVADYDTRHKPRLIVYRDVQPVHDSELLRGGKLTVRLRDTGVYRYEVTHDDTILDAGELHVASLRCFGDTRRLYLNAVPRLLSSGRARALRAALWIPTDEDRAATIRWYVDGRKVKEIEYPAPFNPYPAEQVYGQVDTTALLDPETGKAPIKRRNATFCPWKLLDELEMPAAVTSGTVRVDVVMSGLPGVRMDFGPVDLDALSSQPVEAQSVSALPAGRRGRVRNSAGDAAVPVKPAELRALTRVSELIQLRGEINGVTYVNSGFVRAADVGHGENLSSHERHQRARQMNAGINAADARERKHRARDARKLVGKLRTAVRKHGGAWTDQELPPLPPPGSTPPPA